MGPAEWLIHPYRSTEVLAMNPTIISVYDWSTQKIVHQRSLIFPEEDAVIIAEQTSQDRASRGIATSQSAFTTPGQRSIAIEDILISQNQKSLIITMSTPNLKKKRNPRINILDTELLRSDAEEPCPTIELRSLPCAINQSLLKPLAMLDPDRLLFLDTFF